MRESGRVIRTIGPGIAEVEVRATSACAKCGICRFDRSGILSVEANNGIGAAAGDNVEIEFPEGNVILSSLMVFIFPLIAFFAGYIIKGIIFGAVLLTFYLIFLYFYDRKARVIPKITHIV